MKSNSTMTLLSFVGYGVVVEVKIGEEEEEKIVVIKVQVGNLVAQNLVTGFA